MAENGVSRTDPFGEGLSGYGSLKDFGVDDKYVKLAQAISGKPREVDPAMAAFLYFSRMGELASQPGATLFGSAAGAASSPAEYMMNIREQNRKREASVPATAINLMKALKPPTAGTTTLNSYTLQKDIPGIGSKNDVVTLTNANAAKIINADPSALLEYTAPTSGSADKTRMDVIIKGVVDDPETLDIDERVGNILRSEFDPDKHMPKSSLDKNTTSTIKTVGSGTLAKYMSREDAEAFVTGLGLPPENSNYNRIVDQLTARNDDQIGQAISDAGVYLEVVPLAKDGEVINLQLTPSSSAATPYFVTYVEKRLPLIAKSADTYNTTAREVIPRVDEALALLKTGQIETGRLNQALLPFKQVFNQAFGINDPEVMGLESLQATSNFLAPKMRPVGSGSTSDMEFRAYQQAALYLGNTPKANYISLYAFKKMAENGVRLNQLEQELLTSGEYSSMKSVNEKLNDFDSGIFEKWTGDPNDQEGFLDFYNSLPDGAVIINNGLFDDITSPYIIKGWGNR